MLTSKTIRRLIAPIAVALIAGGAFLGAQTDALAQMAGHGGGMHSGAAATGGMHRHGSDGTGHDMANMPGLRGLDATPQETAELAVMFNNFQLIDRTVENLPNGIRTVTHSADDDVMDALVSHVTGMIGRVEDGRDPQIFIQSPTLDIFFMKGDRIETDIEVSEEGIVVVQTSDDPEMIQALQVHAAEVTAMADRGMEAVHEMMMQRAGN